MKHRLSEPFIGKTPKRTLILKTLNEPIKVKYSGIAESVLPQKHLRKLATKKCNSKVNKKMLPEKLNRNSLLQQHMPLTCDYQKRKIGGGWLEIQKDKLKASYP